MAWRKVDVSIESVLEKAVECGFAYELVEEDGCRGDLD